ncbi:hypothetical protein ACA910_003455 [Epithemia clementina (nom. ined.)]
MSACSSFYTNASAEAASNHQNSYAYNSGPAPQAWSSPVPMPTIVQTTAPDNNTSIQQEKLDKVSKENLRLNQEIQELREQVLQLLQTQKQQLSAMTQSHNSQPPAAHQLPSPIDYGSIDSTVIETLLVKKLIQVPPPTATTTNTQQPLPLTHDHPPVASKMDMSFAGNISRIDHEDDHE